MPYIRLISVPTRIDETVVTRSTVTRSTKSTTAPKSSTYVATCGNVSEAMSR
jgi:hypothetical protein